MTKSARAHACSETITPFTLLHNLCNYMRAEEAGSVFPSTRKKLPGYHYCFTHPQFSFLPIVVENLITGHPTRGEMHIRILGEM